MRILRGLASGSLGCGCFVGVYETYDGTTIGIIDERGPGCTDPAHHEGTRLYRAYEIDAAALTSASMVHATVRAPGRR
jgi:hypothetical protein